MSILSSYLSLTLLAVLAWGCEDIVLKKSTQYEDQCDSLKISFYLGMVAGIALLFLINFSESGMGWQLIIKNWKFLFIPAAYGISMIIGNIGLKYLNMSIMSPVENASGAFPGVILLIYFLATGKINDIHEELSTLDCIGSIIVIVGLIALAFVQQKIYRNNTDLKDKKDKKIFGALALLFPLVFCLFDTFDTVICGIMLHDDTERRIGRIDLLILYNMMFFIVGLVSYALICIKEKKWYCFDSFNVFQRYKILSGFLEVIAYIAYIFAMAKKPLLVAPIVSSYCIVSVVLSKIFLKEKLKLSQYLCVFCVIVGIIVLGISEGIWSLEE